MEMRPLSWSAPIAAFPRTATSGTRDRATRAALMSLVFALLVLAVQQFDAPLVLLGGLALLIAVPLFLRPELATLATVFLLYINFPAILTKQHGIPASVAGSFILLLGIPLMYFLVLRREPLRVDRTFLLMVGLLTAYMVSSLVAVDLAVAKAITLEFVMEGLLLYLLVVNVVRSMRTLRRIIWTLLAAGALLGSLAVYQEATGSYREFGGLAYRNFEAVEEDADREGPAKRKRWDRAQGPVNEPNRFAQIMIVLLPLGVWAHRAGRSRSARGFALLFTAMIFGGVALTLSRAAFTAIIFLGVSLVWLRWVRVSRIVLFAILLAVITPSVPFILARITSLSRAGSVAAGDARTADGSVRSRTTLMLAALNVYIDHPLIGVGPGQFNRYYGAIYARDPAIKLNDQVHRRTLRAHSLYLEIAAEGGTLALGIFIAIVGGLVIRLWRVSRNVQLFGREHSDLATALSLTIALYLWTGVFIHLSYVRYYWFLLAIAGAALHLIYQAQPPAAARGGMQIGFAPAYDGITNVRSTQQRQIEVGSERSE
jgi:putative inorganic carbon (hco3(-)) transporter